MKNMKKIALTAAIIASLGLTTAYAAATANEENPHKMRDLVAASQQTKNAENTQGNEMQRIRPRHKKANSPFATLAKLTGQDAEALRKECRRQKINPVQYADKLGKYDEFKAARLKMAKTRLDQAVNNGKITQAKADEFYKRMSDNMELARQGKRPNHPMRTMRHKTGPVCDGPQGDVIVRCNPDGSTAEGCEGMSYREHPMYGHLPFDTLAKLTGKTSQDLYAEAYKDKLTCAGLAKKLGVYDQYKAERLNEEKTLLAKAVQDGRLTQEQADKRLANVKKRIDNCQGEMHGRPEPRNGMGKHHPRFSPMHPGPQVPPDAMQE